uniref:response regulator n=1 Tax=Enterocloster clostridioformis TaxID=1531 RepID=UPI002675310A
MKIAILDDCSADIGFLETLILESNIDNTIIFDDNSQAKAEFYEFADGETLLAEFDAFDIIFFDINLGTGMDGLQTAERIRERDTEVMLVFYSASDLPGSKIA